MYRSKRATWQKISGLVRGFFYKLRRNMIVKVLTAIFVLAFLAAYVVYLLENSRNSQFSDIGKGVWWALVTMTTVGYGDKVPVTTGGRIIAALVMFSGVALVSFFTATVSSIFITKRLNEGKGLSKIRFRNHIVIVGWNSSVERIIRSIRNDVIRENRSIVLVNQRKPELIDPILLMFNELQIKFVYGDVTDDVVLNRANIAQAFAAVIVPDESFESGSKQDERTILATLSIKSIEPKVRVIAHILDPVNETHLRRANADRIVLSERYSGYLLGAHVTSPGIPEILDDLLNPESGVRLARSRVPGHLVGKSFAEAVGYFKKEENRILLGFAKEEPGFMLDDILSDQMSSIDMFIRRKLEEAGKGLTQKSRVDLTINPPLDYVITERDVAVIIENV
ncbi:NAD-binding protein [candidate division KSB1 bacterium]|nr:NAD-binding protein [candidate division KSB1 bacterium]